MVNEQLFEKAAVFTDIHFGKKNNSREHNIDCEDFVEWFIDEAKEWGADTAIFCGDWHDSRRFINVSTMNYSLSSLEKLDKNFGQFFFIPGNHDLFYREKRDVNSIEFIRSFPNTTIIKDPVTTKNVTMLPWLVGNEWKKISKITSKYIFGHFELPYFLINSMVEMPDVGGLNVDHFQNQDYVFSGHFHKRQVKRNVIYIGNAFPHNFSDAWDDDRGAMLLEWGKEPEYRSWPEAPKYRSMKLSDLLDNPDIVIEDKTHARITMDIPLTYEQTGLIKDIFVNQYNAREIMLIPTFTESEESEFDGDVKFESVDQMVMTGLKSFASTSIDSQTLIDLYHNL